MVIFVGNKLKMGGLVEVAKTRLQQEVDFIEENYNIKSQENDILLLNNNPNYIVYDTTQYFNDPKEIIDIAYRIYKTNKAKPIFLIPTDNPNNEIIKNATSKNFKYYINTSLKLGEQKNQFEKIVAGFYDVNEDEVIAQAKEVVAEETKDLTDFVEGLYNDKQRQTKKENTYIIKKKKTSEIIIELVKGFIKTLFTIISICLMGVGVITLLYSSLRVPFLKIIKEIFSFIL